MMNIKLLILLPILLCACAHSDPWTGSQIALEGVYQAANLVDLAQTNQILKHPDEFKEKNKLIEGLNEDQLLAFKLGMGAVHLAISDLLPARCDEWWKLDRVKWLWISSMIQVGIVGHNAHIGLRLK